MCAYKLVTVDFAYKTMKNRIETFIHDVRPYKLYNSLQKLIMYNNTASYRPYLSQDS